MTSQNPQSQNPQPGQGGQPPQTPPAPPQTPPSTSPVTLPASPGAAPVTPTTPASAQPGQSGGPPLPGAPQVNQPPDGVDTQPPQPGANPPGTTPPSGVVPPPPPGAPPVPGAGASQTFYRGNTTNSIGEPARILVAPYSNPYITKIEDIFTDMTSYNLNSTYGFQEIGLTRAALAMRNNADVQQWENQQFGRYRIVPTHFQGSVGTDALEMTPANKVTLMQASQAANPTGGAPQTQINFPARTAMPQFHVVALHLDQNGKVHAHHFPLCMWDGAAMAQNLGRGEQMSMPFVFTAYPDPNVIDPATGQACFRQDFDQI